MTRKEHQALYTILCHKPCKTGVIYTYFTESYTSYRLLNQFCLHSIHTSPKVFHTYWTEAPPGQYVFS